MYFQQNGSYDQKMLLLKYFRLYNFISSLVLDGLKHDDLSSHSTPNLDQIRNSGVLAPRLQAEFPSFKESFLTSLLTGHYVQDHGILSNEIFFEPFQSKLYINDSNFWNATRDLGTVWVSIS